MRGGCEEVVRRWDEVGGGCEEVGRDGKVQHIKYTCFLVSLVEIYVLARIIVYVIGYNIAKKVLETMLALVTLNLFDTMAVIETMKNLSILTISHPMILLQLLVIY